MAQADLAVKLNVTDKAVSRWKRGIVFPDINTLEPLASALDISIPELIKSERIVSNEITKEEAMGKSYGQTVIMALALLLFLIITMGLFSSCGKGILFFLQVKKKTCTVLEGTCTDVHMKLLGGT